MSPVWYNLVAYHALTKLLGEFHGNVAIVEDKAIRLLGERKLAFGHRLEKHDYKTPHDATISRSIGVPHECTQEPIEVPGLMKNGETDEELHDAFE